MPPSIETGGAGPGGIDALVELVHRQSSQIEALQHSVNRIEYQAALLATGRHPRRDRGVDMAVQHALMAAWRNGPPLESLVDAECQFFSQNGEDGILLYLFGQIGTRTRRAVEICAGDGIECNSANLIMNHGWHGLLVDGNADHMRAAGEFYATCGQTWFEPPVTQAAWVTAENVDQVITTHGLAGEIDLLTIDVDGMDWWIWRSLTAADPTVVVVEFTPIFGAEERRVLPYDAEFVRQVRIPFAGASLAAVNDLAVSRGYRLVGVEHHGFNAFFVKSELAGELPSPTVAECLSIPSVVRTAERMRREHEPHMATFGWIEPPG